MNAKDKGLVLIWLHDIIENPDDYYSVEEQQELARQALELIGDIDCVDYVVAHKAYPIQQDDLYKKLCVGYYRDDDAPSEYDGISIPEYNDRINECTGLYWIWKNATSKYVGLSHYRRFFYREAYPEDISRLDRRRIKDILVDMDYDAILSLKLSLNWSVYKNMCMTVGEDFCKRGHAVFRRMIGEKQPEYLEAFDNVFADNRMHACNMFVMRHDILSQYCEWLFSFLLDATDQLDVSDGDGLQKRTAGYFAEIMWTVWLAKQNLKIYELPIMQC